MQEGMQRGMGQEGVLPAPTALARRAHTLHKALQNPNPKASALMVQMDWVNLFAMAVSEENANGGRVVTAPTNGACGIVPAVLMYIHKFIEPLNADTLLRFFLVSSAIGGLFKRNASISGAEVGCQGEVGVASMALARNDAPARVSLDQVVEAMRQTGKDMNPKYRETSCGGLAVVL